MDYGMILKKRYEVSMFSDSVVSKTCRDTTCTGCILTALSIHFLAGGFNPSEKY